MTVYYAHWVPSAGMSRMYRELAAAWGNPNQMGSSWPQATLEAVCERGPGIPYVFDFHTLGANRLAKLA